jgi:hypothetical protein
MHIKTFQSRCISEHANSTTRIDYNIQFLRKILLLINIVDEEYFTPHRKCIKNKDQYKTVVIMLINFIYKSIEILLSCYMSTLEHNS